MQERESLQFSIVLLRFTSFFHYIWKYGVEKKYMIHYSFFLCRLTYVPFIHELLEQRGILKLIFRCLLLVHSVKMN
jgi:hypothetical protein